MSAPLKPVARRCLVRGFVLALLAIAASSLAALAEDASPEDSRAIDPPVISLLTFGPGSLYWERFGHNAILVRDPRLREPLAYNYGIFDFQQKNFFFNFARGRMSYRVAADSLQQDLRLYQHEHRWVREQRLALTPAQATKLADFLDWNAQPEHADYRYDYFLSNCSTRVRDALDEALGGALRRAMQGRMTPATYRFDAVRLIAPDRTFALTMDLALGPTADRPIDLWAESFVPMVLMQALRDIRIAGADGAEQPLVEQDLALLPGTVEEPPAAPPDYRWPFLLAGLALAMWLLLAARLRTRFAGRIAFALPAAMLALFSGLGGLALVVLWAFTEHWAGWRNANLLSFSPLALLLIPATLASLSREFAASLFARRVALLIALGALVALPVCLLMRYQDNLQWILLMLPPQLALGLALQRMRRG